MIYEDQLKKRYKKILNYMGVVLIIAGVIMLLPLLSLPFYRSEFYIAKYFLITASVNIAIGLFLRSRYKEIDKTIRLSLAEGGIIIVSSWFFTILLSSFPFIFSGMINFHQAMFEAVSGWTTTGLSLIEVESAPKIILLWRSIMQFFGGAGFSIIMLSAIIGPHGIGMQSIEGRNDKILPTIEKSTRIFFMIYFTYFFIGIVAYLISGMPFFDALNHSMTAISTGGNNSYI